MGEVPDIDRQPLPEVVEGAVSSHDLVAQDLVEYFGADVSAQAVAGIGLRKAYGIEKYGTILHPDNGRDHFLDALDEAEDLVVYLRTAMAKNCDVVDSFLMDYHNVLRLVISLRSIVEARKTHETS